MTLETKQMAIKMLIDDMKQYNTILQEITPVESALRHQADQIKDRILQVQHNLARIEKRLAELSEL